jgi:CheY-like chemotaxis protein
MSKDSTTIMVVEDETLLLQAITKKLKLSGLDVVSCASGQQALDYLESLDELPAAIWLDYYLKDMNGLAFMQTIKDNPKWKDIPVCTVSNSMSPEKVHNMLALGAKKYILKAEYRLDEIIAIVLELIKDSTEVATEQGSSGEAPPNQAPPNNATPPAPAVT